MQNGHRVSVKSDLFEFGQFVCSKLKTVDELKKEKKGRVEE